MAQLPLLTERLQSILLHLEQGFVVENDCSVINSNLEIRLLFYVLVYRMLYILVR